MRNTIACVAGLAAWALLGTAQSAEIAWPPPNRPVQILATAPGGISIGMSIGRLVASGMQQRLGGQFNVADTASLHGQPAIDYVAASEPDGTTLLLSDGSLPVADTASGSLPDMMPIGLVALLPNIIVVNRTLPVHDLKEFTEYVRLHPGEVNFGSIGHGTAMHLAGQLYMDQTGSNMVHIPYTSAGQAVSNLISGEIQSMFQVVPAILRRVRTGEVRPLAIMSAHRSPALPQVPTAAESGYSALQAGVWLALQAPAGTPDHIMQRANQALNESLQDDEVRRALEDMGAIPAGGTMQDAAMTMKGARARWQALLRKSDQPIR